LNNAAFSPESGIVSKLRSIAKAPSFGAADAKQ